MKRQYEEDREFIENGCRAIREGNAREKKRFFEIFRLRYEDYIKALLASKFHLYDEEQKDAYHGFLESVWSDKYHRLSNYKGDASFKTYLYAVLRYFMSDWRGRDKGYELRRVRVLDMLPSSADLDDEPDQGEMLAVLKDIHEPDFRDETTLSPEEAERFYKLVQEALGKTLLRFSFFYPQEGRILLMDLCGLERKEMAAILKIKENTLNQRISRTPYGIRERFGAMFKEVLRTEYGVDIDLITENFSEIFT